VALAKKGISLAAKLGLGPILEKLKALVKPLLKRVIQTAIGKLPVALQPVARKLAERLPFLKEVEEGEDARSGTRKAAECEIQLGFDRQTELSSPAAKPSRSAAHGGARPAAGAGGTRSPS
jgi:hypothetical protein